MQNDEEKNPKKGLTNGTECGIIITEGRGKTFQIHKRMVKAMYYWDNDFDRMFDEALDDLAKEQKERKAKEEEGE